MARFYMLNELKALERLQRCVISSYSLDQSIKYHELAHIMLVLTHHKPGFPGQM